MTIIHITAKCSNLFAAQLVKDKKFVGEYDGVVPDFMPGQHFGDYVELNIDVDTGMILNWKKPTAKQLKKTFAP